MLNSCGTLDPVNDYFGIKMNPDEEENFRIVSYNEEQGIKYQSSLSMDSDINAWAELGVEAITFKVVNNSEQDLPLDYHNDKFIIITNENEFEMYKGPRIDYFYGTKISPGSNAEITLKMPSEFAQDFEKRKGALLQKDIMGDISKNWSQNKIIKDNIVYIIIKLSDSVIVLKQVPEN